MRNGKAFPEWKVEIMTCHESGEWSVEMLVAQQVYLGFSAFFISAIDSHQPVKNPKKANAPRN